MATIICSETTTTHSCGHHSIQTVHRCDRDNCVYMAHPRESSTELCDVCQCLNRLNQGGFNRFNPGAYDVLRQQVLTHRAATKHIAANPGTSAADSGLARRFAGGDRATGIGCHWGGDFAGEGFGLVGLIG
ncbi:MAG: hypothetical protein FRX48_09048 [Lasallia pustulata]|uniref:Uncharacterized protein n=1 Tax=Lasallia pustulata TaxID=136370 RepID=A0A5M8PE31_9LECA|nr:MAG: hypothetical protein FRX48_09048 [Lasallia pustulata]